MSENPFLENWTTPFGLPPFDRIRPEHFPPAFDRAMAEHNAEIATITGSAAAPTFVNTIEALERSGRLLDRVSRVFFNTSPASRDRSRMMVRSSGRGKVTMVLPRSTKLNCTSII